MQPGWACEDVTTKQDANVTAAGSIVVEQQAVAAVLAALHTSAATCTLGPGMEMSRAMLLLLTLQGGPAGLLTRAL